MDPFVESEFVAVKEEQEDHENSSPYEDESSVGNGETDFLTVKAESGDENHQITGNGYTVAYPSHLLENRNPAHFYIAKLSHKLNSKLNNVLSPQNGNVNAHTSWQNYYVSEEYCIGGDGLKCPWCPATATHLEELQNHKRVCGLSPSAVKASEQSKQLDPDGVERPYACNLCDRRFARSGHLKRHYISHTTPAEKPLTCLVCNEKFSSPKSLKEHQVSHLKYTPYVCPKCNKGFPSRETLRDHARVHVKDLPFSCRVCGKRFMQAKNLNFHMKVHSGCTIYPCDECEKGFDTEAERTAHKKQHNLLMPYKCDLCNQSFPTKRQKQKHSDLHDIENPQKCVPCNKVFLHEASFRTHVLAVHGQISSVCSDCNRIANSVTCDENEEFMCEDCDVPFLHKNCLAKHIMDHPKNERIPCETCGKAFPYVSAYHRHMLTHTERPFRCTECKRTFHTRVDLKEHMHKHWRDRPFACKVCGEKVSFNNMMTHLLSHAKKEKVLNDTGNTKKGLDEKMANRRSEERRRSQRATARKSYAEFDGESDEFEESDALSSGDVEMYSGATSE